MKREVRTEVINLYAGRLKMRQMCINKRNMIKMIFKENKKKGTFTFNIFLKEHGNQRKQRTKTYEIKITQLKYPSSNMECIVEKCTV